MFKPRRILLGGAVTVVFLFLFLWKVDFGKTMSALAEANYWWIIPAIVAYFIAVYFRTTRWHFLLSPMKVIDNRRLFPAVVIGYMANNLLPVRLGEFVRAYVVGRREGVPKAAALATILIERVFDGVFLIVLAFVVWPFLPVSGLLGNFSDSTGIPQALLVAVISIPFVLALLAFCAIAMSPRLGTLLIKIGLVFIPGKLKGAVGTLAAGFLSGMAALRNPRRVVTMALLTAPIWLMEGAMYWLIAMGFRLGLGYHAVLLTTSTSNLATSLPSSAGGVGPFEYATRVTLEAMSVPTELGAAYAIVLHVVLLAPVTLLGCLFLWMEDLSLKEVANAPSSDPLGGPLGNKGR